MLAAVTTTDWYDTFVWRNKYYWTVNLADPKS